MLALVDDVLDFSRIEAGQLKVSAEPTALAHTVCDAVALLAPLAAERDVTLQVDARGLVGASTFTPTSGGSSRCCSTCSPTRSSTTIPAGGLTSI